jgi:hypothetical protein
MGRRSVRPPLCFPDIPCVVCNVNDFSKQNSIVRYSLRIRNLVTGIVLLPIHIPICRARRKRESLTARKTQRLLHVLSSFPVRYRNTNDAAISSRCVHNKSLKMETSETVQVKPPSPPLPGSSDRHLAPRTTRETNREVLTVC